MSTARTCMGRQAYLHLKGSALRANDPNSSRGSPFGSTLETINNAEASGEDSAMTATRLPTPRVPSGSMVGIRCNLRIAHMAPLKQSGELERRGSDGAHGSGAEDQGEQQ
ncbi:hypothetical protein MBLNU459_g2580t2 [Dothideomycetes sp. NU459]